MIDDVVDEDEDGVGWSVVDFDGDGVVVAAVADDLGWVSFCFLDFCVLSYSVIRSWAKLQAGSQVLSDVGKWRHLTKYKTPFVG